MEKKHYRWVKGSRFTKKNDAQAAGECLEEILDKYGSIRSDYVVKEAKKKSSPIHDLFTWDDSDAAMRHREREARELIRGIETFEVAVEEREDAQSYRAFVTIQKAGSRGKAPFHPTDNILSQPDTRHELIMIAYRELETFHRKYQRLTEFAEVFRAIDKLKMKKNK